MLYESNATYSLSTYSAHFRNILAMNTLNQSFGLQVKRHRKEKGISQEDLASLSGLHRTYIGSIERGERNVSLNNVEKIAISLEVPVTELIKPYNERL